MYTSTLLSALAVLATPVWAGAVVVTTGAVTGSITTTPPPSGYTLQDDYFAGNNFFGQFSFWTGADPTHGFVQYQSQSNAQNMDLLSQGSGNAQMRVDSTNVQPNGRPSVRLTSNKSYNSGLVIIDLAHMPGGICGTWPAFWMVGPNWPYGGEIDIIEGVNDQSLNSMTLHTGPGCSMSNPGYTGTFQTANCASSGSSNIGCGIQAKNTNTYGSAFNAANGGVYATEITGSAISIWFFARDSIPSDITSGTPTPSGWGTPLAMFSGACNIPSSFTNLQLVFDTTFCGDWAGNVWSSNPTCSAKASTCNAFVANNPSAFSNAYWDIRGLKVYQKGLSSNRMARDVEELEVAGNSSAVAVEWQA